MNAEEETLTINQRLDLVAS